MMSTGAVSNLEAIDLFAGLGGWTEGARRAGVRVRWAGNHWPLAVQYHSANHPETDHVCQDLHQVDWSLVPRHDLLLASPACQGHTPARGKDRPHHDSSRSTAWAVVSCVEFHKPKILAIENVKQFIDWQLFPAWRSALEALGYSLSINMIDTADCGVPQHRVRVFIIGTQSKRPLLVPQPAKSHVPASQIIDFKSGNWTSVHRAGRAKATLDRYAAGRRDHGKQFLMPFYGSGSGLQGRSISRPIGTITTRARWAVVDDDRMRMLSVDESRAAMGFPSTYRIPNNTSLAIHMLGNAVSPPQAEYVIRYLGRAA